MKVLKVIQIGTCDFCERECELCEFETESGRKSRVCWKDFQKLARMNLKEDKTPEKAKV